MTFKELAVLAWCCLRKPRSLNIRERVLVTDGRSIDFFSVRQISLTPIGWWIIETDLARLRISYRDVKGQASVEYLGKKADLNKAAGFLQLAIGAYLSGFIRPLQAQCKNLEVAAAAVFVERRYVRHSEVNRFLAAYKDIYRDTVRQAGGLTAALLSLQQRDEVNAIIARLKAIEAQCVFGQKARDTHNQNYIEHYRKVEAVYFATIESQKLTAEQIDSALVFDDATQVIAAAGSGKSSCIVAKIGLALKLGLFKDHEIIALSYNSDAAANLAQRIESKVGKALNRKVTVASQTFHKFGRSILVDYYGKECEPKILKEEGQEENRLIKEVISDLLKSDVGFRNNVAEWFSCYAFANPEFPEIEGNIDECAARYEQCCRERIRRKINNDRKSFLPSVPTLDPEKYVRSLEERNIANWLYLRDVEFQYETIDRQGSYLLELGKTKAGKQKWYRPDFTYSVNIASDNDEQPTITVIHEHFGLDHNDQAPAWLGGDAYAQNAKKKRKMFLERCRKKSPKGDKVIFLETRSAQMQDGSIWQYLEAELTKAGVTIGPIRDDARERALQGFRESTDLEKLFIEFVFQFKESGLSEAEVTHSARERPDAVRTIHFLQIAFAIFRAYQARLKASHKIDFADMLRDSLDKLSVGDVKTPYRFFLVDEFQDISRLRADLVKAALAQAPSTSLLFCVGDDWQTINRFSGSDLRIFIDVDKYFERHTKILHLTQTFRSPQSIADIARAIVMTNPQQIDKPVRAKSPKLPHGVRVVHHAATGSSQQQATIEELERIIAQAQSINIQKPSVLLLRRTKFAALPEGLGDDQVDGIVKMFKDRIDLQSLSVHRSKGLESDFVLIVGVDSGSLGFPDERPREALKELVLPPLADLIEEERRLFYVGLTRAKHQVVILANEECPSPFVLQLDKLRESTTHIDWVPGSKPRVPCPRCEHGSLQIRDEHTVCSRGRVCGYRKKKLYVVN